MKSKVTFYQLKVNVREGKRNWIMHKETYTIWIKLENEIYAVERNIEFASIGTQLIVKDDDFFKRENW